MRRRGVVGMADWIEIPIPPRKSDWRFKKLRLLELPPKQGNGRITMKLPFEIGTVVSIQTRRNAKETCNIVSVPNVSAWGDLRILELVWCCSCCGSAHRFFIPETWVAEGKAVFVAQESYDERL